MTLALVLRYEDGQILSPQAGAVLLEGLEVLDEMAAAAGLQGPSDCADQRAIPEDFVGDAEELNALLGPSTDWYDTAEASENLRQLADALGNGEAAALAAALTEVADLLASRPGRFQFDVS